MPFAGSVPGQAAVLAPAPATPVRQASRGFYRPELDVLRLFAFFAVFLTHTLPHDAAFYASHHISQLAAGLLISVANAGAFGVSLFFMLSAYLITSLLLQEMQKTGTIALGSFYLRRILRIWPLYFFALALAALWPDPAWRMPGNYVLAYLLLAGNWMTVLIGPPHTFASILWSVSIEEQFYLSWPLLAKWLRRDRLAYGCVAIIAIANLSRIALTLSPLRAAEMLPNTLAQLDVIAVGALVAVAGVPRLTRAQRALLGAAGIAALVTCGHFLAPTRAFAIAGFPAIVLGCLALLLATCGLPVSADSYAVRLGKISYGLYVYHKLSLLLVGMALHGRAGTVPRMATYWFGGLALTIILAEISYRWLETPFLRLKQRYTVVASRPV